MATYDLTQTMPTSLASGDMLNCPYSGSAVSITLPKGTYKLQCWGAQGGYRSSSSYGGNGGYSYGELTLTEPTLVYLYAGGSGNTGGTSGGFNGGGIRGTYSGGGGGSDIRIGSDSLYARVIVAGGGGSDGSTSNAGMYGGGTAGGSSTASYTAYIDYCGKGGTQTCSGYSSAYTATTQSSSSYYGGFGFGGSGINASGGYGGAGGGGWYGGSGTYPDGSADDDRGGGGGSGYVYTSDTVAYYPSGCLLNSSYYLSSAVTASGNTSFCDYDPDSTTGGASVTGRSGNGVCKITVVECSTVKLYVNNKLTGLKDEEVQLNWLQSTTSTPIVTNYVLSNTLGISVRFTLTDTLLSLWQTSSGTIFYVGNPSSYHIIVRVDNGLIYVDSGDSGGVDTTTQLGTSSLSSSGYYELSISSYNTSGIRTVKLLYNEDNSNYYSTWGSTSINCDAITYSYPIVIGSSIAKIENDTITYSNQLIVRLTMYAGNMTTCQPILNSSTNNVGFIVRYESTNPTFDRYSIGSMSNYTYETNDDVWHEVLDLHCKIKQVKDSERYALPNGYTQLEYIQGTGEQYIDIGVQPTNNTNIWLRADFSTCGSSVWGALHTTNGTYSYGLVHINTQTTNQYTFEYGTQTANTTQYPIIPLDFILSSEGYRVAYTNIPDSKPKLDTSITSESFTVGYNLYLNAMNNSGSVSSMGNAKYYRCLITNSYTPVRYFIPALENSTGNVGMYDLITNAFYRSATSVNFVAGLTWYPIRELNIRKSDGWQQIALGGSSTHFDWENASWSDIYNMCKAVQEGTKTFADYGYDLTSSGGFNSKNSKWGLGSCKKVTLSSTVLGATEVEMMVICVDTDGSYDGVGTITFQAKNTLPTACAFSNGNSYSWSGSYLKTYCTNFYNYCDAKSYIKTLSKYTCNSYSSGSATTSSETVWIASLEELGIYSTYAPCIYYSGTYEYTVGCSSPYPYYAKTLDSSQTYHIPMRNIRTLGDDSTSTCTYMWTRTLDHESSINAMLYGFDGGAPRTEKQYAGPGFVPCFTIG